MQGAGRKEQYRCFFRGAPIIIGINDFYTWSM